MVQETQNIKNTYLALYAYHYIISFFTHGGSHNSIKYIHFHNIEIKSEILEGS